MPPHRFFNALYAWLMERVEDREKFLFDLTRPDPGKSRRRAANETSKVSDSEVEDERRQFDRFAAAFGVSAPKGS